MQISDLAAHGFDVAEAMELCINDEDIYKEVLFEVSIRPLFVAKNINPYGSVPFRFTS